MIRTKDWKDSTMSESPTEKARDGRPSDSGHRDSEDDPVSVVERYLAAVAARDFPTARGFLAEEGFQYQSPIASFSDRARFAENMDAIGAILHNIRILYRFVDGATVCHILDVTVNMTGYQSKRVVQIATVIGSRITRLEVVFDASSLRQMIIESTDEED
jgi:hypothetical protein